MDFNLDLEIEDDCYFVSQSLLFQFLQFYVFNQRGFLELMVEMIG